MRVCVLGAGAIGGFIGTRLAAAGVPTAALARGATLAALRARGWQVESGGRRVTAPVQASSDPAELGEQDLVILAVKAQSAPSAAAVIRPLLGPQTMVLTAMNGVPWWFFDGFGGPCQGRHLDSVDPGGDIAAAIPVRHVIGGVVHMSCSVAEPGVIRQHHGAGLIIGEPGHTESPRIRGLAGVLESGGFEVTVSSRIHTDVWYKLWGNMTINPVSVLTGPPATGSSTTISSAASVRRPCGRRSRSARASAVPSGKARKTATRSPGNSARSAHRCSRTP